MATSTPRRCATDGKRHISRVSAQPDCRKNDNYLPPRRNPRRGCGRLLAADGGGRGGTLTALKALRRELADPKVKEHRGRVVKTTGDGLLVEFGSVVDAVRSAVEVQREMAERNADVPSDRRIEFRMGISCAGQSRTQ